MFRKVWGDVKKYIVGAREYNFIDEETAFLYPIDLDFTLDSEETYYSPKDINGVPQKRYSSIGITYNPTRIASYGFSNWNRYQTTNDKYALQEFEKSLKWFMTEHNDAKWEYLFDWGKLKKPWISCMSQGEAISILVRGYILTENQEYLTLALKAVDPFTKSFKEGGVLSYIDEDIFFEEYPSNKPVHVLNGFLYSLIGLLELQIALEKADMTSRELDLQIELAISTLEKNIEKWDLGYWSAYDLDNYYGKVRNACTISYHNLHISQLKYIAKRSKSTQIKQIVNKWEKYMNSLMGRIRALIMKSFYRIRNPAQR